MKTPTRSSGGSSLLELILFLGILAIMFTTVIAIFIATQETRARQQGIAEVEQRGSQLLATLTKSIRRAETVLAPATSQTGSILALQMALNAEHPTIFAETGSGNLLLVQKTSMFSLLNTKARVQNLRFRNNDNTNVVLSFDLTTVLSLVQPTTYSRHFETTVTLFPDDQSEAGGCVTCPAPICIAHQYRWYHCLNDVCTQAGETFSC